MGSKSLLLFVHGIFGDTIDAWKARDGTRFFDLILEDEEFCKAYDVFAFGFLSSALSSGSFDIPEAARRLYTSLQAHRIDQKYDRIIFVAHSMGGLVTLQLLLERPALAEKVPLLVTFGTPYNGSQISELTLNVIKNPALAGMIPIDGGNNYLSSIHGLWLAAKDERRIRTRVECAYETVAMPIYEKVVVARSSAAGLCSSAEAIPEDHLGIVKPRNTTDPAYEFLTVALRNLPPFDPYEARVRSIGGAFAVYSHTRVIDATQWNYVPKDRMDKKASKVVMVDRIKAMRSSDFYKSFLLRHATTSPIAIEFESDTHDIVSPRETIEQPAGGYGKALRTFDVAFDVSDQPVGQWFDLHLTSTYWNAMNDPARAWTALPLLYKTDQASMALKLPKQHEIERFERRQGSRDSTSNELISDANVEYDEQEGTIDWRISAPKKDWVYTMCVRWERPFLPTEPHNPAHVSQPSSLACPSPALSAASR